MRKSAFGLMFIAIMLLFGSCKVGRYFWYNFSDITDHKIFPSRPLHGSTEPFRFIDSQNNAAIDGKVKITNYAGVTTDFKTFIEK